MFVSLVLVCTMQMQCVPIINGVTRTETQCEIISEAAIRHNLERAERGEIPDHTATYRCVSFGQAL